MSRKFKRGDAVAIDCGDNDVIHGRLECKVAKGYWQVRLPDLSRIVARKSWMVHNNRKDKANEQAKGSGRGTKG